MKFHFGNKILCLKSRLYVKLRFVKSRLYCIRFIGLIDNDAHYAMNVPQYLNLGTLGLTLAHEILHSLDRTGRDFDRRGTLRHWWRSEDVRGFQNASSCLVDQYSRHFKRPLRIDKRSILVEVDGDFTLNENVCDVDGLRVASDAFLGLPDSRAVLGDLIHLPNNPYTPQQLFFINAAQGYCSHLGPISYVLYLELDEHSPNPERVDGIMMNSNLFNSVFQCPIGSRMNPKKKCSVWT